MAQTVANGYIRKDHWFERLVTKKSFWLIFCGLAFSIPLVKSFNRELPPELPVLSKMVDFNLTTQYNRPYGLNDLKGKVFIASFYTSACGAECGELLKSFQKIQHRIRGLGTKVALLSFTTNPSVDNVETMFKAAEKLHANGHVWKFLTGDKAELVKVFNEGFRFPIGMNGQDSIDLELSELAASKRLVLVDHLGNVRGHYRAEKNSINRLMIDIGLVINRK